MCLHLFVCIVRGWRLVLKEEALSGTEAFCRCCREEGANGKSCGYQSYDTLWQWPHSNPNSVFKNFNSSKHWKKNHFLEQSDLQVEMAREKKSLKNMFTSGAQGWCRSLRFPSWSISQSVGGWDSLLFHWDVTWGMLISVFSVSLPCFDLLSASNCPYLLFSAFQHWMRIFILCASITCNMHVIVPCGVTAGITVLLLPSHFVHQRGALLHM